LRASLREGSLFSRLVSGEEVECEHEFDANSNLMLLTPLPFNCDVFEPQNQEKYISNKNN